MDWTQLAQDRVSLLAVVTTVINSRGTSKAVTSLTSGVTISF
jgi:hypothetical protein